ncbi:FAD-dependent oxidoreductase [Chitinimonas sp.]|uniref:FAD-dependent oxidoreductase n=1 Tax=Chitinimonas sp. TaxID=1934313 RepID=UPI0035B279A7
MNVEQPVDIAIIGAGPAGLAAMQAALAGGARVALIDDNPLAGGQIWRGGQHPDPRYRAAQACLGHERLQVFTGCRLVAAPAAGTLLLEEREHSRLLRYLRLIIASGARERLLPFPGWTLPGVTGAGALQAMVKQGLDVRSQRVVLAGSGPLLLAAADTLLDAGADLRWIAEQASWRDLAAFALGLHRYPGKLLQAAGLRWRLRQVPYRSGSHVAAALGRDSLRAVRIQAPGRSIKIECDWLGVGYGLLPNTELASTLGCTIRDGAVQVDALQRSSIANVYAAGEATGIGGVDKAWLEGRLAGLHATDQHRELAALQRQLGHAQRYAGHLAQHFTLSPAIKQLAEPDTVVCRCEDVSYRQLAAMGSWREAKLQTRCGMGPCQGRICGAACQSLFGWSHVGSRPPLQPARLGTLALTEIPQAKETPCL